MGLVDFKNPKWKWKYREQFNNDDVNEGYDDDGFGDDGENNDDDDGGGDDDDVERR